jgi:hypothetical protein
MLAIKEIPQKTGHVVSTPALVDPRGIEETLRLAKERVDTVQSGSSFGSGTPLVSADMFWVQILVSGSIMAGLSAVLFWKARKYSKNDSRLSQQSRWS